MTKLTPIKMLSNTMVEGVHNARLGIYIILGAMCSIYSVKAFAGIYPPANALLSISIPYFSGRPDPGWFVTDPADVAYIKSLTSGLSTARNKECDESLGKVKYIILKLDKAADFPEGISVHDKALSFDSNHAAVCYNDEKNLKAYLAKEAQHKATDEFDRKFF